MKGIQSILTTGMKRQRASWRQKLGSTPKNIAKLKFMRDYCKATTFPYREFDLKVRLATACGSQR